MQKLDISSTIESTHSDRWLRKHTLHVGDKIHGILVLPKKTSQSIAVASTAQDTYHFLKKGFLKPEIHIIKDIDLVEAGTMTLSGNLSRGKLTMANQAEYTWRRPSVWKYYYEMRNANQELICSFHYRLRALKGTLQIEVTETPMQEEERSLLLLIGWYLMFLVQAVGRFKRNP